MINTSAEYKEKILKNRILHHEAKIEFADGTILTPVDADLHTFKISDNTSSQNSFDVGTAIANQLELKINNIDGEYSKHNFSGAKITARAGLELSGGKTEWLKKGVFYAQPGIFTDDTVSVTAMDSMTKFDVSYSKSNLQYPAALDEIVEDACRMCDVSLSPDVYGFIPGYIIVGNRPADTSLTFRQILEYVGEIACVFFKINVDGKLTANWYNTDLLESEDIKNEEVVKIEDYTGTIETDDVVITGVKVIEENISETGTEKNETEYICGSAGYILEIKENKLIQDGEGENIAELVGEKVNGMVFRPLTIKCLGNPAIEAGDIAIVTDRKGRKYKTILTGVTYTAKASQELLCGAEAPERLSATRYSKATQVYRELRKQVTQQRSEFTKALDDLQTAMAEKQGLYPVTEKQEDGSNILYFCNKQTRAESKIVIELNAKGWGMSTDGGKTWNAGALVDGTTITKILNTIGINADWINAGAIAVKKQSGDTIFSVNVESGKLVTKMAEIGGWKVDDTAIYKDVISGDTTYRAYFQPPLEKYADSTWILSCQKKTGNGAFSGSFVLFSDGTARFGTTFLKPDGSCALGTNFKVDKSGNVTAGTSKINSDGSCALGTNFKVDKSGNVTAGTLKINSDGSAKFSNVLAIGKSGAIDSTTSEGRCKINGNRIYFGVTSPYSDGWILKASSNERLGIYHTDSGGTNIIVAIQTGSTTSSDEYNLIVNQRAHFKTYVKCQNLYTDYINSKAPKSRVVNTQNYDQRKLYCYEMPTPVFGDIGEGFLDDDGRCIIMLDDIFFETVNTTIEYQVFLQKEGKGDIWLEKKELKYFEVLGTPGLKFAWEIKVKQIEYEYDRLEVFLDTDLNEPDYEEQAANMVEDFYKELEEVQE